MFAGFQASLKNLRVLVALVSVFYFSGCAEMPTGLDPAEHDHTIQTLRAPSPERTVTTPDQPDPADEGPGRTTNPNPGPLSNKKILLRY